MASSGMKDFYRQKKKGGVTKASSSSKKKTQQYTGGASVGASDTAQTSALVSHGSWDLQDDFGEKEEQLRQFDMDMKFGPCIGVSRLQRWERASAMGLQPPGHVRDLLLRIPSAKNRSDGNPSVECLWEGKVEKYLPSTMFLGFSTASVLLPWEQRIAVTVIPPLSASGRAKSRNIFLLQ